MAIKQPIIGIPCRIDTSGTYRGRIIEGQSQPYLQAIQAAGGLPILIPLTLTEAQRMTLFNQVDGLLFAGGGDIAPQRYRQAVLVDNLSDIQEPRDESELHLMRLATEQHKPFLAICRGIQVMNVANGGTLWQDVASQVSDAIRHDFFQDVHAPYPRDHIAHQIKLDEASRLTKIVQTDCFVVNSLHHQGVQEVAPNLQATGYADDGLVEVLEVVDHPFGVGVQWHPEELVAGHETAQQLFTAFVEATQT